MRRVPRERDGRTDAEKSDPNYREFIALWEEIDESQMYTAAKGLQDVGYDFKAATMAILTRGNVTTLFQHYLPTFDCTVTSINNLMWFTDLEYSIGINIPVSNGITQTHVALNEAGRQVRRHRCSISAHLIWPLLVNQWSESEKISLRVRIAQVVLHETFVS